MTAAPTPSAIVVGGSVAGLAAALFLARQGVTVTVLDHDAAVGSVPIDAAQAEVRRSTPQAAHSHIFLSRLRLLLAERAPDVLEELRAAGAHEIAMADGRPDPLVSAHLPRGDELVALAVRRSVFEAAVRGAVLRQDGVALVAGTSVTGLRYGPAAADGTPVVVGVDLEDGTALEADVVIDASGRRTSLPGWLAEVGVEPPTEVVDCGISYVSRFYERRPGATPPRLTRGFTTGSSFDRYSCLVFPGEGRTFSVTFGILPEDRELRGLTDGTAFEAAVSAIPSMAWWVQPHNAVPISDAKAMNGLKNRMRRYVVDGRPLVLGLAAVGDAASTTNPAHSRGTTLAFVHAAAVADAVVAAAGDRTALALAVDAAVERDLQPWFDDSIAQDALRLSRWRPAGEHEAPVPVEGTLANGEAAGAAQLDPEVWARFARLQNLLETPDEVLADPALVAAVRRVQASGLRAPGAEAPSHDELAALVAATRAPKGPRVPEASRRLVAQAS
ncbi:FAD-dependent oxidoreductase [Aquihabitans sp. G128]|uniref:NAD(P)/FAD-dependent oxidoreductase n=1 Tax=Aquihabitans sp. G128 TaxID=2849779 RepID=UPI001C2319ED|nr:FAD-dependent oxidoreductase [Aquihabitans sp. G128]QXC61041.1 FAD-dependent oxidoreductase [Aquihabitans sp. G128]